MATVRALAATVREREAARQSTSCSYQILWELKLLTGFSADFTIVDNITRRIKTGGAGGNYYSSILEVLR